MPRPGRIVSIEEGRTEPVGSVRAAVLAHLDELYRFALRMTGDAEQAEELIHEAVLKALKREKTAIQSPRAWLFRILYHTFVSRFRKKLRHEAIFHQELPSENSASDDREAATEPDPLASFIAREDVRNAVASLPEEFRVVVWLSDAEGFSLREVAEIAGCPLGTAASRLARGRQRLRRLLAGYGAAGEDQHELP